MKIKPFRSYDEHEVINLYSLLEDSGNAGDFVEYVSWNPSDSDGYDGSTNLSPFGGISIPRYVSKAKVKLATSGSENVVAGILLYDVRTNDALGRPLIFDAQRYNELQVVYSGQTVPMCKRGMVVISGFAGTPAPGSGIGVHNSTAGGWKVLGPAVTPSLGKFLSSTGADGYAVANLLIA